jgi:hypothetical protein
VKLKIMPNLLVSNNTPEKIEELHRTMIPLEAPMDGEKAKLSKRFGQNFLMSLQSKDAHFVSCKQTISHSLSSTFECTSLCLSLEFSPRTFQHSTLHFLSMIKHIVTTGKAE